MSNVVDFNEAKQAREPHWEGPTHCVACHHEWHAVAPAGTDWLECPSCGLHKGRAKFAFAAGNDQPQLVCRCGCDVLYAYKPQHGAMPLVRCCNCGGDLSEALLR